MEPRVHTFAGTYTALITPFRDGEIDFEALDRLIERQVAAGVDGLVPCGTTGESPTLSEDEQQRLIQRVVAVVRRRTAVIAGAGSNCTATSVRRARMALEAGADGLMLVAPYYNRPTQEGLFQHFSAVAAAAAAAPIMLYNIPGRCGVEIAVETIRRLRLAHANIVAVKHATGTVDGAAELRATSDIVVLSGDDPLTLPLMALGARGVVSVLSNLAPSAVRRLTRAALSGDFAAAARAHDALYAFGKALFSLATNPIPIKSALALQGMCREEFRLPMTALATEAREKLRALLAQHPLD
ncbi:MAG: 4-hydroxy-tetrahydrodipicolinate synthase [Phycisphaerae bacterium]|nr:4-hydroxy-tetrahydrodipicolinate synthase [Phycisphaerae bacterium]